MVTLGILGEGPSVPLHPDSVAGTLSLGGLPLPPDPSVGSSKSSSPSRKSKSSGIPRRYLVDLVQRYSALLAIKEFIQEAVILNIEAQHEEEGLDDGFGVYEILAEEDPVDEEDGEIEDAAEITEAALSGEGGGLLQASPVISGGFRLRMARAAWETGEDGVRSVGMPSTRRFQAFFNAFFQYWPTLAWFT
ncbi:hypothetical protein Taro_043974 [Colocasia esculenta]|uniref:Uncharacterized protein n=1 Tax=Colocasia esculenta TaxID=4460 RepID=A0A843WKQ6_COLES|nr:hypothetical protein [Colocasia esculenta]